MSGCIGSQAQVVCWPATAVRASKNNKILVEMDISKTKLFD